MTLSLRFAAAFSAALATLVSNGASAAPQRAQTPDKGADADAHASPSPMRSLLWLDAHAGAEYMDLETFKTTRNADGDVMTVGVIPRAAWGPAGSIGFGVRLLTLLIGARGSVATFHDSTPGHTVGNLQLYTVDLELAMRIPAGRLEPFLVLDGGYSVFGGLGDAVQGLGRGLDIDGANLRAGLGVAYYASSTFSMEARATGEVMFLARRGVSVRDLATPDNVSTLGEAKARALQADGSSVGSAVVFSVGPALHF